MKRRTAKEGKESCLKLKAKIKGHKTRRNKPEKKIMSAFPTDQEVADYGR